MMLKHLDRGDLAHFGIEVPEHELKNYQFYQVSEDSTLPEYWDVIALHSLQEEPMILEMRLTHIDPVMLPDEGHNEASLVVEPGNAPSFNPLIEGPGWILINASVLEELLHLFETWAGDPPSSPVDVITHFRPVSTAELTDWHVTPTMLRFREGYWRYMPDEEVSTSDEFSLLRTPEWFRNDQRFNLSSIEFVTFRGAQLEDPSFDPFDTWGLGHITLNRSALRDFIALLRHQLPERP